VQGNDGYLYLCIDELTLFTCRILYNQLLTQWGIFYNQNFWACVFGHFHYQQLIVFISSLDFYGNIFSAAAKLVAPQLRNHIAFFSRISLVFVSICLGCCSGFCSALVITSHLWNLACWFRLCSEKYCRTKYSYLWFVCFFMKSQLYIGIKLIHAHKLELTF